MKLAVPAVLLTLLGGGLFAPHEVEPNDAPDAATILAAGRRGAPGFIGSLRRGNGLVVRGRLEPGDVDWFAFAARAGDVVTLALEEPQRGELHDGVLAVFGPGDEAPAAVDDDGGPGFLPRLALPVDETGTWRVAVTGFGDTGFDGGDHEQRFAYRLVVAVATEPPRVVEEEHRRHPERPDRSFLRQVRLLPRGAAVLTGELEPGDTDRFALVVPPRSRLTASVFDEEGGELNDSVLRLASHGGESLAADDDGGPGFLSNLAYASGRRARPVVLELRGFDPDPEDARPHEEAFRYRLVVSLQDASD